MIKPTENLEELIGSNTNKETTDYDWIDIDDSKPKYVAVGMGPLALICNQAIERGYTGLPEIHKFFEDHLHKFLIAFGESWQKGKPADGKADIRFKKLFDKIVTNNRCVQPENHNIIIDSGGYQSQIEGYILDPERDCRVLIDNYHEYLMANHKDFTYAFHLDLVPSTFYSAFDNWDQVKKWNQLSCEANSKLPKEIQKKMIHVLHCNMPTLAVIWDELFDEGYVDDFYHFSAGGTATASPVMYRMPVTFHALSLLKIANYVKKRKHQKKFRFHLLGVSDLKDVLAISFFKQIFKDYHDIDVYFTYDSSTLFRMVSKARTLYYFDWENKFIERFSIKQKLLDNTHRHSGKSGKETFIDLVNEVGSKYNFKKLDYKEPMYIENGQFSRPANFYSLMYMIKIFTEGESFCDKMMSDIYPLFKSGHLEEFNRELYVIMQGLNSTVFSKTLSCRTLAITKSMEMLRDFDMDYCDYIINQTTHSQENSSLNKNNSSSLVYF